MPCSSRKNGDTHTKVTTEGTLSGFQEFFLQPIIKARPNKQTKHTQKHVYNHHNAICVNITKQASETERHALCYVDLV